MLQWTYNAVRAVDARRYEKEELISKLAATSLQTEVIWCYGFPVLNWTYPLSSLAFKNKSESLHQIQRRCPTLPQPIQPSISLSAALANRDYDGVQRSEEHTSELQSPM